MKSLRTIFWSLLVTLIFLALAAFPALADERIFMYDSQAVVSPQGSLTVREDITVNVEHRQIRRGIYRDFPTIYKGASGGIFKVGFTVEETLLDGLRVPHSTKDLSNGVRIYLGDPKANAPLGKHTYTIIYTTTGQLGFFENHDELYWNVTGNGWDFAVDKARFSLAIPGKNPFTSAEFYTGYQGDKGQNAQVLPGDIIETTSPLKPNQGLTVVYTWPKGIVLPPQVTWQRMMVQKYPLGAYTFISLVFFLVYLVLWRLFGKDAPMEAVIPLFKVPPGESPGFLRYFWQMGMDNTCFAAEILSLAVKGHILIKEDGKGGYHLIALEESDGRKPKKSLTESEKKLFQILLGDCRHTFCLSSENCHIVKDARKKLYKTYAQRTKRQKLLKKHTLLWAVTGLVSLFYLGGTLLEEGQEEAGLIVFYGTFLCTWLGLKIKRSLSLEWAWVVERGLSGKVKWGIAGGILLFVVGGLFELHILMAVLTSLICAFVMVLFRELMPRRTPSGVSVLAKVRGLLMYMGTAEEERLKAMEIPRETPETFEALMPCALALGVAETWGNRFEKFLRAEDITYDPGWYGETGSTPLSIGQSLSSLGASLSETISSASSPPGSSSGSSFSSGSSGGGYSGGGGGGGGGGGW